MRPIAPAVVLAAALSVFAAGEASAHARLLKSDPATGATVAQPKVLTLRFSEGIVAEKSSVSLAGADGKGAATGPLALDKTKKIVSVPVSGRLAPGAYKASWKMTSEDGHTMTGELPFKVK